MDELFELSEKLAKKEIDINEYNKRCRIILAQEIEKEDIEKLLSWEIIEVRGYKDGVYGPQEISNSQENLIKNPLEDIFKIIDLLKTIKKPIIEHTINVVKYNIQKLIEIEEYELCAKLNKKLEKLEEFVKLTKHLVP